MEKKLDEKYTKILRNVSKKSWKLHSRKLKLYDHLSRITKAMQVEQNMLGWRIKDKITTCLCILI